MPARAPLEMPKQRFDQPFSDPAAVGASQAKDGTTNDLKPLAGTWLFRLATFLPALTTSLVLILIFMDWFRKDGFVYDFSMVRMGASIVFISITICHFSKLYKGAL